MNVTEYSRHDATSLGQLVNSGEIGGAELVDLARQAHNRVNPRINAILEFYDDAEDVAGADEGPFNGVPFLRKDLGFSEAGRLMEAGSRLFRGRRGKVDSFFFERARAAGLRIIGRTTTPEFGISGFSESILNGVTGNPWNPSRTAGGSSAGAAAAVASGIVPLAQGGDGGGSIRTPAAWCGLVGLNPSRGRISGGPDRQDPGFGFARQFVLCRSVRDMAAALDALAGPSPGDPFIISQPVRAYTDELKRAAGILRVGIATTKWAETDTEPETMAAVESAGSVLAEMGHTVVEMNSPYDASQYSEILLGMSDLRVGDLERAASAMSREISEETLEPINLRLFEHGKRLPLSHAGLVHEAVRAMRADVGKAIDEFDILITPVMPSPAMPHGGDYCATSSTFSAEEWMNADADLYQYLGIFNVTGQPSVSLPLAHGSNGLPIGIQCVGRFGDEATLVRVARDLESAFPWSERRPPIHVESC